MNQDTAASHLAAFCSLLMQSEFNIL